MMVDPYFDRIASPILFHPLFLSMKKYYAHGDTSVYEHSLSVAIHSYRYAKSRNLNLDYSSLIRGALLHDFYLYDWHHSGGGHKLHGFRHPFFAYKNAKKYFSINKKEGNIIRSHMFPFVFWILPLSKEAWIVLKNDKRCAIGEMKKGKNK